MSWTERAQGLLQNVWTHHQAELMRLQRARLAKAANVDPDNYAMPFPPQQHVTIQPPPTGMLKGALLAAALLGAGGAGGLAAGALSGQLAPFFSQPQVTQPAPAPEAKPLRYRITFRTADGKPLRVEESPPRSEK